MSDSEGDSQQSSRSPFRRRLSNHSLRHSQSPPSQRGGRLTQSFSTENGRGTAVEPIPMPLTSPGRKSARGRRHTKAELQRSGEGLPRSKLIRRRSFIQEGAGGNEGLTFLRKTMNRRSSDRGVRKTSSSTSLHDWECLLALSPTLAEALGSVLLSDDSGSSPSKKGTSRSLEDVLKENARLKRSLKMLGSSLAEQSKEVTKQKELADYYKGKLLRLKQRSDAQRNCVRKMYRAATTHDIALVQQLMDEHTRDDYVDEAEVANPLFVHYNDISSADDTSPDDTKKTKRRSLSVPLADGHNNGADGGADSDDEADVRRAAALDYLSSEEGESGSTEEGAAGAVAAGDERSTKSEAARQRPFRSYRAPRSSDATALGFDAQSNLIQGTAWDIVDYLINQNRDRDFLSRFLLMFRSFMTPAELLEALYELYCRGRKLSSSSGAEEESTVLFIQPVPGSSSVRQRVAYVLNRWVEEYFDVDFDGDKPLRERFALLVADIDESLLVLMEAAVKRSLENKRQRLHMQGRSMPAIALQGVVDAAVLGNHAVFSVSPAEAARQLTLLDFDMFERVEPIHFLSASKGVGRSPAVTALTTRFNCLSAWLATCVISKELPKERAALIKFFIGVGRAARDINNFNLVMGVLAGLNFASVQRLKKSWKQVSSKARAHFEELEGLMSSAQNFHAYRTALGEAEFPKLPYFGVFLRDLQFTDVGNSTYVGDKESSLAERVINYDKVQLLSASLRDLEAFQTYTDYDFPRNRALCQALAVVQGLEPEKLHEISVALEPIQTQGPNYLAEEEGSSAAVAARSSGATAKEPRNEEA